MHIESLRRRDCLLAAAGLALGTTAAHGQDNFPSRPVRLVVPFAPGGAADVVGRRLAEKMDAALGQRIVVENKGGASGQIGTDYVAKAPADGYTVLLAFTGMTSLGYLNRNYRLDATVDLAPIGLVASAPLLVVANAKYKTLADLVHAARTKPGGLNFGVTAVGDLIPGQVFKGLANIPQVVVRFNGAAPALSSLVAGDIDYAILAYGSVKTLTDRLNVVATMATERYPALPNLPTTGEQGFPALQFGYYFGLTAPAAVPKPIHERLERAMLAASQDEEFRRTIVDLGMLPKGLRGAEFKTLLQDEMARNDKAIREGNISFD